MNIIKLFINLISWIAIGLLALMGLYIVSSNFDIFGGYKSFLVQSGSMEPAIMTGDIILIHNQTSYLLNDVVTFRDEENRTVTHRLVEIPKDKSTGSFSTKGDANRSQDAAQINQDQIIGKVVFVIPKLGYLVAFSKSLPGLIILIMIPALMFLLDQLFKLKNA